VELVAHNPSVRLLCGADCNLCFDPILEARYRNHPPKDDEEKINVGRGHVLILRGIVLPIVGLFLAYLVPSSQGRFRC
jgi:hypothetical protein